MWHAHLGWLFDRRQTNAERYAPDLLKDTGLRRISGLFVVWAFLSLALPAVIGGLLVSTGLSLVFVPAIFILMDDAQRLLARLFRPLVGGRGGTAGAGAGHGPLPDGEAGEPYRIAAE